jgi:glycosidase/sugar/nucleoside kinase (ribokinase family)
MPSWVPDAVFYQVLPDRLEPPGALDLDGFAADALEAWEAEPGPRAYKGGTLRGVLRHLDRIAELGFTALTLTPVHASPTYHRYKPVDLVSVDHLLGGEAAFTALLDGAHARGLRVIVDFVVNHVGAGFAPFMDVVEYGARSPYRDWFHLHRWPVEPFGPSPGFRGWNGNASMPVLNQANPRVRAMLVEAALAWVRRGVDGLRLDAAGEVEGGALFDELRAATDRLNPETYLFGEIWADASRGLDGKKWHGATNYPFHFAMRELAGGRHLQLAHVHPRSMQEGGIEAPAYARRVDELLGRHAWEHTLRQLNFLDGHDVARFATVVGGDSASLELGELLLFTFPGAPCVYYGAEVGMEGGMPPDSRRGFPHPDRWNLSALDRHRRLIALRRKHVALRRGTYRTLHAEKGAYLALRQADGEAMLVAVNAGESAAAVRLTGLEATDPAVLFGRAAVSCDANALVVELAARSGALVQLSARREPPRSSVTASREVNSWDPREAGVRNSEVVVVGNIGVDTNVYLPDGFRSGELESAFTEDLDAVGQAGGYSSFGFAALGRRAGFVGYVGEDPNGRWIAQELADARIVSLLFTDPAGTARSVNLMASDGTRKSFYDGKSHMTLAPDLGRCRTFLEGAQLGHFHLSNWARRLLPVARELGLVVSTDLQDVTRHDDPYRRDFIEASNVLFCSAVNLEPERIGTEILMLNPRAVVIFGMGARGAASFTAQGLRHHPPVELERPVVDTNGAGDSLAVGFLTAYVLERRPLEEAVFWGQVAARWACAERLKWRRLITRDQLDGALSRLRRR